MIVEIGIGIAVGAVFVVAVFDAVRTGRDADATLIRETRRTGESAVCNGITVGRMRRVCGDDYGPSIESRETEGRE